MFLIIELFFLIALIRLIVDHEPMAERPGLVAVVYTMASAFLASASGQGWGEWSIRTGLTLPLAWLYFWLLARLGDSGPIWWLICLLGLSILLV